MVSHRAWLVAALASVAAAQSGGSFSNAGDTLVSAVMVRQVHHVIQWMFINLSSIDVPWKQRKGVYMRNVLSRRSFTYRT